MVLHDAPSCSPQPRSTGLFCTFSGSSKSSSFWTIATTTTTHGWFPSGPGCLEVLGVGRVVLPAHPVPVRIPFDRPKSNLELTIDLGASGLDDLLCIFYVHNALIAIWCPSPCPPTRIAARRCIPSFAQPCYHLGIQHKTPAQKIHTRRLTLDASLTIMN